MWFWLMNAITFRSMSPLHDCDEVVAHRELVLVAELEDAVGFAVLDQLALALRERVGEQDGDLVLVDLGLGLGRTATCVLVKQLHH